MPTHAGFYSTTVSGTVVNGDNVNYGTLPGYQGELNVAGKIPIATGAAFPAVQVVCNTLTAGAGINIANGPGTITITNTGSAGITFNLIAVNTVGVTNNGYVCNAAATVQVSLPAVSAFGDIFIIERNLNLAGLWQITQAAGQQILAGSAQTTVGAAGTLTATNFGDVVVLRCIVANLTWSTESITGSPTAL